MPIPATVTTRWPGICFVWHLLSAKARCLRDLDNIGITCLEELGDLSEVIGAEAAEKGASKKVFQKRTAKIEKQESPSEAVIDVTPTSVTTAAPEKKDSREGSAVR